MKRNGNKVSPVSGMLGVSVMAPKTLDEHIEVMPGVCGGKPRIRGRRVTVAQIAAWHLRLGMPVDEIADELDLGIAPIHAALAYYFDHRREIDARSDEDRLFVEDLRRQTPSILAAKLESLAKQVRGPGPAASKRPLRRKKRKSDASSR